MPFSSASWLLRLAVAAAAGQVDGCKLSNQSFRQSQRIQDSLFRGAFALDLSTGINCIREVTTPSGAAVQTLLALADFYDQFYAFRAICRDPPVSPSVEAAPFDVGIFGSARGGSPDWEAAKVDLVNTLRTRAAELKDQQKVSIVDWYVPLNSLFNRLRDAHVNFRNGGTKVDAVLNSFVFYLQDDLTRKAVTVKVSATRPAPPDTAVPSFIADSGRRLTSIDGIEPMRWFETNLLENSAFGYPFKSVGARANHMLKLGAMGFAWLGSNVGDVSNLKPTVKVVFEDASETTWSWTWLLVVKDLQTVSRCELFNGTCYMQYMSDTLETPGSLWQTGKEAWDELSTPTASQTGSSEDDERLLRNVLPNIPDEDMVVKLRQEPAVRDLLGIAEEQVPGTKANIRNLAGQSVAPFETALGVAPEGDVDEEPQEPSFNKSRHRIDTRTWMLNPVDSPATATYGFYEVKVDEKGDAYLVLKLTRFYLSDMEGAGFDYMQGFIALWKKLISTAKQHGIHRLLVDVNGNSGGYVNYAYLFVRAIFPELPFGTICNEYDRPVGSLYEKWAAIDPKPLFSFLNDSAAIRQRADELNTDPTRLHKLKAVTRALTTSGMTLDLFDDDQMVLMSGLLDDLDMLTVTPEALQKVLIKLAESLKSFGNPFAQNMGAYNAKGKEFDPYQSTRVKSRGGVADVKFTAKYRVEDCALAFTQDMIDDLDGVYHSFEEILFVTDGLCGSSCDTATRTSYLISKKIEQSGMKTPIPRIDFVTWGGLGGSTVQAKSTLSGTSYPGGNVQSNAMYSVYNPVFLAAMFGYLMAEMAGADKAMKQLDEFKYKVPQYPYYASKLPRYSQSELYQNMLGSDALPAEYYFFPADIYLPDWYYGVRGMPQSWNESELDRMYLDASRAFNSKGVIVPEAALGAVEETVHEEETASSYEDGSGPSAARVVMYILAGIAAVSLFMACASLYFAQSRSGDPLPSCDYDEESTVSE